MMAWLYDKKTDTYFDLDKATSARFLAAPSDENVIVEFPSDKYVVIESPETIAEVRRWLEKHVETW